MGFWLASVCFGLAVAQQGSQVADTVFRNGRIYTLDAASTEGQALAVNNGMIVFAGSDDSVQPFIGPNTVVVDLDGRMAMPGLIDAHMHVSSGGEALVKCDLNYETLTIEEVLQHLQTCIDAEPDKNVEGKWLEAVNFDLSGMTTKSGSRTKADLDKLNTVRPVILTATDHHTFFVNSIALKISGINASTPDPAGGRVDRLPGSREPSGMLQDTASELLAGPDPLTVEELKTGLQAALRALREAGVTTFQEAVASPSQHDLFQSIQETGGLSARPFFDYRITVPDTTAGVDALVKDVVNVTSTLTTPGKVDPNPVLKWQAVKIFMDGIIMYPANTGAVIGPYLSQVGNSSEWVVPPNATVVEPYVKLEPLAALLGELAKNRVDAQIHADGDAAVRRVLDAVEAFRTQSPNLTDYKIAIAHAELSHPDDWKRRGDLGVDAIVSFQWAQPSATWDPLTFNSLGSERVPYLEAFVDIAEGGRPVIYGSDWPIDPLDEFLALKAGVTRQGDPQNPHSPASQGAPFNTSTFPGRKAARFLRADTSIGSLEVGKVADVIVLDKNYFEVPEEEIARQKVLLTMLGGEVLYVADGTDLGRVVTPKFPNTNTTTADVKNFGGFSGRAISEQAKELRSVLGRRHTCHH
ncbi:amidohydrolase 3 [Colletotrichum plurivorum]|uniref:Amidohydrolase 3 n=1 Tax=Colletotrichum plurivorum TaxID=2175906 RepID=A0A8H6K229_9PEZI|nr:amidohydrolase 3 [Colletotrichum plurivorum]